MSIVVLGTVALDTVETPFGKRLEMLGGSATHFSMSARLFTKVNLVAVVGEDFPQKHIGFLKQKGLILDSLLKQKGKTFRWDGEYKGDLNSAITKDTKLGVLAAFSPRLSQKQRNIKYLFLANVDPDIQNSLLESMPNLRLVGLDSMNYWIHTKRDSLLKVLKKVDIYVANDQEAKDLSGESNLIRAAKSLRRMGPKFILIKKGEHGVFFYSDNFIFALPAFPIDKVIDPTGAGDTFAGGFMGYLAKFGNMSPVNIRKALAYATVAASFNVEDFGPGRTSKLSIKDLNKRLAEFKKFCRL
ncbi:MAG: PfkB family carbohydrate kinase [Candidatus Omnitrophica bacterium]|jgi:sugar/nucleoside kinase (ribokinase family)|nr:PfkB family carbohydrate kinase [Candidatus Omnitrophota bacterium]